MDGNLLDLFAGDDATANNEASALANAIRARRAAGTLGMITGDPAMAGVGRQLAGNADALEGKLFDVGQARLHYGPQMEEHQNLQAARQNPAYAAALRDTLHRYGSNVSDDAPAQVLERLLPVEEKFAQANMMGGLRYALQGRLQQKTDPGTGETYLLSPLDGATYYMNGSPRTHGVRRPGFGGPGFGSFPGAPGGAPAPAPAAGPAPAAAPRGAPASLLPGASSAAGGGRTPLPGPATAGGSSPAAGTGGGASYPRLYGKVLDAALQKLGTDFDPNKSGGEIQRNQARLNAAIRLRKLVTDENGNVKAMIPPQFMRETAAALAGLISNGGQPAQSLIEELSPRTGSSKVADIVQWITAHPQDAGQQAFAKLYLESANREAEAAQEALNQGVSARFGKHQRVVYGNPEEARRTLEPYGWTIQRVGRDWKLVPGGARAGTAAGPAPTAAGPARISSDAEYDALPSGAQYVGPDGKLRRKR
ncbi:hypothetical protein [Anaeromyxobacter oryzisoli]|uniref:hypothetical protein n=1 Tax=Anaeromyxobacter oryzisoli TaxID=2925408 RepID=UPI001F58F1C9|nr:hypothetical protein [Anaeromyxobacter sp. SG63]